MKIVRAVTLAAALPLGGCIDLNSVWERVYQGSTKGFQYCRDAGTKQGLSLHVVQQHCIVRHEKVVSSRNLNGKAGYRGAGGFSGAVTNNTSDIIFTAFTIVVRHNDAPGAARRF